ncbi:hypothetical protein ACM39_16245 [Chryseobacterium sp. FH2]|uniref:hypothetical protein n=1 Tax=Chryseobacterium sp. FH2 TaxID=1674291 RepID=UPI00065AC4E6|nr:hypothetical protein [Chryseobacterium sp. FH2]KMQ65967.1 hypothetical protein ACM39_16245 [Chryseobacterium sp. FH2]
MKKALFLLLISLFALQSCNINSEIVYHKDSASTAVMDIDIKQFVKEMKAMTPDSLKGKEFGDMDKLPATWTSIYDIEKKEGKLNTKDPDSIRIMKKIFMKSSKENNEPTGFALKLDHFNQADYKMLNSYTKQEKLPLDQNIYNNWDGKTLTIDTDNFNLKNIEEAMKKNSPAGDAENEGSTQGMVMMFFKKVGTTLKFDNKIKSISGKHDWFKQTDDHSVRIDYDLESLYDKEKKLKNQDKKIVIITE